MKKIKNFKSVKNGDWILFRNPNSKVRTIVIVENKLIVYAFDYKGIMEKFEFRRRFFNSLWDFYPKEWKKYKLNKKDKEIFNREIILGSLE